MMGMTGMLIHEALTGNPVRGHRTPQAASILPWDVFKCSGHLCSLALRYKSGVTAESSLPRSPGLPDRRAALGGG